ncbi:MAG: hypothetical protein HKM93_19550 [Desulfobacteraceae bacterium]|nr:hypothetical protein [Desulfobacteraceae bacterium]
METAARYSETKIKTYGFETKTDLCICEFNLEFEPFKQKDPWLSGTEKGTIPFEMIFLGPSGRISVVAANQHRHAVRRLINAMDSNFDDTKMHVTAPVELLYFYGPHFGDRFGIAENTLNALAQEKIPLIASACSGSSVFLVLPDNYALKAKTVFSILYDVPQTVQPPPFSGLGPSARHRRREGQQ